MNTKPGHTETPFQFVLGNDIENGKIVPNRFRRAKDYVADREWHAHSDSPITDYRALAAAAIEGVQRATAYTNTENTPFTLQHIVDTGKLVLRAGHMFFLLEAQKEEQSGLPTVLMQWVAKAPTVNMNYQPAETQSQIDVDADVLLTWVFPEFTRGNATDMFTRLLEAMLYCKNRPMTYIIPHLESRFNPYGTVKKYNHKEQYMKLMEHILQHNDYWRVESRERECGYVDDDSSSYSTEIRVSSKDDCYSFIVILHKRYQDSGIFMKATPDAHPREATPLELIEAFNRWYKYQVQGY
ncbi:hypothetical protein ACTRLV_09295 [Corynebacterium durum]|uniref:hypothetical protein n=1 Tax=Corynebacterium durum TaxID=61592 RepID=UPI0040421557